MGVGGGGGGGGDIQLFSIRSCPRRSPLSKSVIVWALTYNEREGGGGRGEEGEQ